MKTLTNEFLSISVDKHGAELCSIKRNSDGREFLWQADPTYWKRHSPVLFPIVGSLWNNELRHDDKTFHMSQHGFARDMDFNLIFESDNELRYCLESNDDTLRLYPFDFQLEIGYKLSGNSVVVLWKVRNVSNEEIYFQIGAHPAFNYYNYDKNAIRQGHIKFDQSQDTYKLSTIGHNGCLKDARITLTASDGELAVTPTTFNNDALILESSQVNSVTLFDNEDNAYLRLCFNAPVLGIWSPAHNGFAPFICIEPWYGRCDTINYDGDFADKDWMQRLAPDKQFNAEYLIDIL